MYNRYFQCEGQSTLLCMNAQKAWHLYFYCKYNANVLLKYFKETLKGTRKVIIIMIYTKMTKILEVFPLHYQADLENLHKLLLSFSK